MQTNPLIAEEPLERWLLLLVAGLTASYTFAPFEFSLAWPALAGRLGNVFDLESADGLLDAGSHFGAFCLVGALFASGNEKPIRVAGFRRFMVHSALLCLVIECLQLALPARHARVFDFLANTFGVWIGARGALCWAWLRAVKLRGLDHCRRHPLRVPVIVALLASGIWVGAGVFPMSRLSTMDWDRDFHLLIGGELDRDEGSWLGEIRLLSIHGHALNAEKSLLAYERPPGSNRSELREKLDLLVEYDFAASAQTVIKPTGSLPSEGLSMPIPQTCQWLNDGRGLLIKERSVLKSRDGASNLTEAIMSSGEFSVEAWLRPLNSSQGQDGPARIISLSQGIWSRNFMLGQEDSDLVFRVRNGINGPNGLRYALRVPDAFQEPLQHFVAIYDHGVSQVFRNGRLLKPIMDLRAPTLFVRLGNNAGAHAAAGILLVLTVALPMYSLCAFVQFNKLRHGVAILATFVTGSLPYVACCILVGGPWRWGLLLWLAIALCIAYPLCFLYVRPAQIVNYNFQLQ